MRGKWAEAALEKLRTGEIVQIAPTGNSMRGKISAGDLVTLSPCSAQNLSAGDVVLARIRGRRYFHLVLHLILERDGEQFLIGNNQGRVDGWIEASDIFGKVIEIEPPAR